MSTLASWFDQNKEISFLTVLEGPTCPWWKCWWILSGEGSAPCLVSHSHVLALAPVSWWERKSPYLFLKGQKSYLHDYKTRPPLAFTAPSEMKSLHITMGLLRISMCSIHEDTDSPLPQVNNIHMVTSHCVPSRQTMYVWCSGSDDKPPWLAG